MARRFFAEIMAIKSGLHAGAGISWMALNPETQPRLRCTGMPGVVRLSYDVATEVFHSMEDFLTIFPCYGKYFRQFSILWKKCFHAVENSGFGLFMSAPRAHGAVLRWLLSGARGAPYRYSRVMDRRGGEPREAPRTRLFITLGRRRFGLNGGERYISTKEETRVARLRTGAPSTKWMSQDFRAGTMRQRSKRILQRWAASRPPL